MALCHLHGAGLRKADSHRSPLSLPCPAKLPGTRPFYLLPMKPLFRILAIARIEGWYLLRYPKLLAATLVIILVPVGYALIYLFSVWDPLSNTAALPVAIANNDRGMNYHNQVFNVGLEVVTQLQLDARFGYKVFHDEEDARSAVRQGTMAFALIIPREFSANAVPGMEPGAGKPVIFTSEGNNYQSAAMARHFAELLSDQINESLNERRWALVLSTAAGSQHSVELLREGMAQLHQGAEQLSHGAEQTADGAKRISAGSTRLSQGVTQFSGGFKQLATGIKALDAHRPKNADLYRLKTGADELANGHEDLRNGLGTLHTGASQLRSGVEKFRDEARSGLFTPSAAMDGAGQLVTGLAQLENGLAAASTGEQKLAEGALTLSNGVGTLTSGVRTAFNNIHAAALKLPEDEQLDELERGSTDLVSGTKTLAEANHKLAGGAKHLEAGIAQLEQALPAELKTPEGSARGLANSVVPQIEIAAPVPNSGSGFAPNVIPGALWLGAGVAAFLLHARVLPRQARRFSRPVQLLGKITIPALIVLAQTACLVITTIYILKIPLAHPMAFMLCLALAGLTFLLITFTLTLVLGDAGKGIAMILLAIQLSSSGGILPVELSGKLFMDISPWLPLTWVVRAVKATMFGAYDGAWHHAMLVACSFGLAAFALACWSVRWRYTSPIRLRPAIEF